MSSPRPRPSPRNAQPPAAPAAAQQPAAPQQPIAQQPIAQQPIAPQTVAPQQPIAPQTVALQQAAAPQQPIAQQPIAPQSAGAHEAEYTESIVVPSQLALGAVIAIAAVVILVALGLWPLAIVAVLVVGAVVYYLGVQDLTVTSTRIAIGQGRGDNSPHLVQAADVVAAEVVELGWPQCYGIGLPDTVDTTRFTVRAGPTVSLTMRDGELLRVSAANPQAVLDMIAR